MFEIGPEEQGMAIYGSYSFIVRKIWKYKLTLFLSKVTVRYKQCRQSLLQWLLPLTSVYLLGPICEHIRYVVMFAVADSVWETLKVKDAA